jgi:outer membrane protein assembly factor BamD
MDVYLSSKWVERAQFKISEAYFEQLRRSELDQTETYEALVRFRGFIEDNPDSPLVEEARKRIASCRSRLARKQYLNAELYFQQNYLEAAALTFKQVMRNYSDTPWYYEALARMGEIARRKEDPQQAKTYWEEVLEADNKDEKLKQKVEEQLKELGAAQGG